MGAGVLNKKMLPICYLRLVGLSLAAMVCRSFIMWSIKGGWLTLVIKNHFDILKGAYEYWQQTASFRPQAAVSSLLRVLPANRSADRADL